MRLTLSKPFLLGSPAEARVGEAAYAKVVCKKLVQVVEVVVHRIVIAGQ